MTYHVFYDGRTGHFDGHPELLTSQAVDERNRLLAQEGDGFHRWVPHFTATAEASNHVSRSHNHNA